MKLYTIIEWVNETKKIECVYKHKRFMWNMTCRMKMSDVTEGHLTIKKRLDRT